MTVAPDVERRCAWCRELLDTTKPASTVTCSKEHRQARWRFLRELSLAAEGDTPKRLAYADPPYPGLADYYLEHPDYAGEVDHRELVSRLLEYDGWALSTSAAALPLVLSLLEHCDGWHVGSWHRGGRPGPARRARSSWEPVIYKPARTSVSPSPGDDALTYTSRPRMRDPDRVIGAKPAAFISWMFGLMRAAPGDSLADLFPGSGGVTRAAIAVGMSPAGTARRTVA